MSMQKGEAGASLFSNDPDTWAAYSKQTRPYQGTSNAYAAADANALSDAGDVVLGTGSVAAASAPAEEGRGSAAAYSGKAPARRMDETEEDEEEDEVAPEAAAAAAATVPAVPDSATLTEDPSEWSRKRRRLNAGNYRQRLNEEETRLRAFDEARTAQRKAAFAQRKAADAAASAAAAAADVRQGSGLQDLKTMNAKIRLDIYNAASENLYPILMLTNAELSADSPDDFREISLTDIFTKKLSFVCDMLFGKYLRENLATMFSQPSAKRTNIRDFFEFDDPNVQCSGVIGEIKDETNCWLCRVTLAGTRLIPCEHKLPLLPALLLTGLYDRNLAAYLIREGKARYADYMELLRFEYGWSHQRCNQIKSDIPFFIPKVNDGKRVTFEFDPVAIQGLVIAIRQSTRHEGFSPPLAWLQPRVGSEEDIVKAIKLEMTPLLNKLNAKNFTTNQLMSHFVRGLLDRVVNLAPAQAEQFLWNRLNPKQRTRVATRLKGGVGGRRRTHAQRRGTYRHQRGGKAQADGLISRYVFDRVKEKDIRALYDNAFNAAIVDITEENSPDALFNLFQFYAATTDDFAFDIIAEIPRFQGGNDEEVIYAFEAWLGTKLGYEAPQPGDGAPGPMRRTTDFATRIQVGGPMGTPRPATPSAPTPLSPGAQGTGLGQVMSPFNRADAPSNLRLSATETRQGQGAQVADFGRRSPSSGTDDLVIRRLSMTGAPAAAAAAASGVAPASGPTGMLTLDNQSPDTPSNEVDPAKQPTLQQGGFKFSLGKRPNWL